MQKLDVQGSVKFVYVVGSDNASYCGCDLGYRKDVSESCVPCPSLRQPLSLHTSSRLLSQNPSLVLEVQKAWCPGGNPESCAAGRR
eukprot:4707036-Amphidinium_carterae.1